MKKIGKIIAILLTAAIAVTMFVIPTSAAGISSAKTFTEGAVLNWSVPAKKSAVCYLKMTFSDSGKAKFSIGSQKTTAKSKYQILDSKGNKKYSGKISALAGKEVSVNKGTYYLKLTLQKGQYVKKLKYTFTGKSPTKKTTGDWLTGYTLTDNEIKQINKALKRFYGMDKFFFNEGEINEEKAINWIYRIGDIVDPYNGNDITGGYVGGELDVTGDLKVPAKDVDSIIFHLFGLTLKHNCSGTYPNLWSYNNGYYYFGGAAGIPEYAEYRSNQKLADGRFLVAITFHEFVDWGSGGNVVYNDRDIYALVSVHKTDGKNYIRLHGVYKNKPSL